MGFAGDRLERMLVRRSPAAGPRGSATALGPLGPADAELVVGRLQVRWAGIARARAASGAGQGGVGPSFGQELTRSASRPLPAPVRERLESTFHTDFEGVRIHTDSLAAQLSERLNAHAFTVGEDVFFARGRYDPSSPAGFALIGHELTHVVQNRGGSGLIRRKAASGARPVAHARTRATPRAAPRRPIGLGPGLERAALSHVRRRGPLALAGDDAFERQAVANERALLGGAAGSGPIRRKTLDPNEASFWVEYVSNQVIPGAGPGPAPVTTVRDAVALAATFAHAFQRYGKKVDLDDPQKYGPSQWSDIYVSQGQAEFNRSNTFATKELENWLLFQLLRPGEVAGQPNPDREYALGGLKTFDDIQRIDRASGVRKHLYNESERAPGAHGRGQITEEDLIVQALVANDGNVPLAVGSIAEVLYQPRTRPLAGRIAGLANDGKDYYRFAGAFVGLQKNPAVQAVGLLGSEANILGNPIAGAASGLWDAGKALWHRSSPLAGLKKAAGYAFLQGAPTASKETEFGSGFLAGFALRTQARLGVDAESVRGLERRFPTLGELVQETTTRLALKHTEFAVVGRDSSERQALANEALLLTARAQVRRKPAPSPLGPALRATALRRSSVSDEPVLRFGSRGDEVKQLQSKLATRGYDVGQIDGIFGTATDTAVRSVQTKAGLQPVDGIVGPATWSVLDGAAVGVAPTDWAKMSRDQKAVALAQLPDQEFGDILGAMGPRAFSTFVWDGTTVRSAVLYDRFLDYAQGIRIDASQAQAPAFMVALELRSVRQSVPDGKGEDKNKDEPEEPQTGTEKLCHLGSAAGDKIGNYTKWKLIKGGWLAEIKEIREVRDLWAETKGLSKVELWARIRELDAKGFRARFLEAKDKDEALKELGELLGMNPKQVEKRARGLAAALTNESTFLESKTLGELMEKGGAGPSRYKHALWSVVPKEAEGGFIERKLEGIEAMLESVEEIFTKGEEAVRAFAQKDRSYAKALEWVLDQAKSVKESLHAFMSGEKGIFHGLFELGKRVDAFMKPFLESPLLKQASHIAGKFMKVLPWVALAGDLFAWSVGDSELKEKAKKQNLPKILHYMQTDKAKAEEIKGIYFGVAVATDVISLLATMVSPGPQAPIAIGVALASDALNLAWTGISLGIPGTKAAGVWLADHVLFGSWRKSAEEYSKEHGIGMELGGIGLPIVNMLVRKKRGFSRYDDDDPELTRIHDDVMSRHHDGPGVSLDLSTKYRLERMLGRDIGEVRLHSGPVATALARETEAEAVTSGRNVYMPSGKLDSLSPEGLGLLAHEVTHVVQAGPASPGSSPRSLGGGSTGEVLERVAHSIERRVVASARASSYPVVQPVVREAPAAAAAAPAPAAPVAPRVEAASQARSQASVEPVSRLVQGELAPAAGEVGAAPADMNLGPADTVIVQVLAAAPGLAGRAPRDRQGPRPRPHARGAVHGCRAQRNHELGRAPAAGLEAGLDPHFGRAAFSSLRTRARASSSGLDSPEAYRAARRGFWRMQYSVRGLMTS